MTSEKISLKPDKGVLAVMAVLAASISGQIATSSELGWYAGLLKPAFNPPNWVFAPAWIALYLLLAFAVWQIARNPSSRARSVALTLVFLQLALNAAWSWMFFAAHSPLLGLVNIVPQFLLVAATFVAFLRLDKIAGLALAPLTAWVGFASVLNASVWWLTG